MVAFNPEVEKFGLVLPSLNRPHSGCPRLAQPLGSRARVRMSDQPSALPGQPSAWAIGCGMAITSGGCATDGRSAGTRSALAWLWWGCPTSTAEDRAAGLHTSGRGPSTRSSQPRANASAAAPEDLLVTRTSTHLPATVRSARL